MKRAGDFAAYALLLGFGGLLWALYAAERLSGAIPALFGAMSLLAALLYVVDKSAARRKAPRIRERSLHLISLAGGWPGALLAQRTLRHKTSKASSQAVFWMAVLANLAMLAWWLLHS